MGTNEIWNDIPEYKGFYQASNLGRIKGLARVTTHNHKIEEYILTPQITKNGYLQVGLSKNNHQKIFLIHRLVAICFIECKYGKDFINHINLIKTDNRVENLEWVTKRENSVHFCLTKKTTSNYTGVSKRLKKWAAQIYHNKKTVYIGTFQTELEASEAYNNYIKKINETDIFNRFSPF